MKLSHLKDFQKNVHELACSKGWWEEGTLNPTEIASKLALIHSEVSEALEEVRDRRMHRVYVKDKFDQNKPEGFPSELADIVIRCLDLAEALGIDLQEEMEVKHRFNKTRQHRHGGRAL